MTKLAWTQDPEVRRIMFLVGDAPPHMDYAQDTKYPEVLRMARERGITVNGLAIINMEPDLEEYYRAEVMGGQGSFVAVVNDFEAFEDAVIAKLVREISYREPAREAETKHAQR